MIGDVLVEREHLFLGSRLKRLAERMQGEVAQIAADVGLSIQPSQYSVLATLDQHGPQTIGSLTTAMKLSQPAVTRNVAKLAEAGLVHVERKGRDQRRKTVTLTAVGELAMSRSKHLVWPRVEAAVAELLKDLPGSLLGDLTELEARLEAKPLGQRALATPPPALTVREFDESTADYFRTINTEWVERMYRMEATDRQVLEHPRREIIDRGGAILFVEATGLGIVGTCALQKTGDDQYELTKMGVLEKARGLNAGRFLLEATIDRAMTMGAKRLYLLSNWKSAVAIRLYERLGFVHDDGIMIEFGARYARCDVAMLYASSPGRPARG